MSVKEENVTARGRCASKGLMDVTFSVTIVGSPVEIRLQRSGNDSVTCCVKRNVIMG